MHSFACVIAPVFLFLYIYPVYLTVVASIRAQLLLLEGHSMYPLAYSMAEKFPPLDSRVTHRMWSCESESAHILLFKILSLISRIKKKLCIHHECEVFLYQMGHS